MRIEQLAFILEIYHHNSMKAASEHLFITPQALSSAVKSLEEELNIQIFHRSNKGISLTEDGRLFIKFAESTIENYHHFLDEINHVKQLPSSISGALTLYVAPVFFESILPFYISKFKQQYPNISIALVQRNTLSIAKNQLKDLSDSAIGGLILPYNGQEIIPTYLPDNVDDFSYRILNRNYYYACVPKDSPLAVQKSVSIKKLLDAPLVDYCAGDIGTAPLIPLLKQYKPDMTISMTISSFSQWAQAIRAHIGIGVMNLIFADPDFIDHEHLKDLVLLKINEPLITFNCFVYTKTPSQSVLAFLHQFPDYTPKRSDPVIQIGSTKICK